MALAAAIQLCSGPNVDENLDKAEKWIVEAVKRGAQLAVLPENFALMGEHERDKFRIAEMLPGNGPILTRMSDLARREKIALVLGGMAERVSDEKVYNSCVYLTADGAVGAVYRKIHLFDVEIGDGATYQESKTVAPGTVPGWVDSPLGKVGLSVCYDVRFPELYRQLATQGARILVVPAAFTQKTGLAHWHVLLRARAIENLCYVIAAAQVGSHPRGRVTFGHSLICDPWGEVLAEAGDQEGVIVAEIDLVRQDEFRRALPSLGHRRL